VTLLALTISVVLGILHADRRRPGGSPRLLIESAHRTVSLLVVAMVGLHVLSSVLDSFAPIRLFDAVLPFTSRYRPLWVGFGAVAFDLLIALILTSVFRARLGFRSWRRVHWLAYACWPVALLHGAGDAATRTLQMLRENRVKAVNGSEVALSAETICVHGDTPQAVEFVRSLRVELKAVGIAIRAPRSPS